MIGEVELGGVFIPPLLLLAVLALSLTLLVRRLLQSLRFYNLVWHAGLFDTALYLVVLWLLALGTLHVGITGSIES
ncbi:MAG: DUF1656 domain-containing protein [Steroidobacteraceae bacterium]